MLIEVELFPSQSGNELARWAVLGLIASLEPALRLLKYLLSSLRSCCLARQSLAFTVPIPSCNTSPVSSIESPSMSRSTKTARKIGLICFRLAIKILHNSDAR